MSDAEKCASDRQNCVARPVVGRLVDALDHVPLGCDHPEAPPREDRVVPRRILADNSAGGVHVRDLPAVAWVILHNRVHVILVTVCV